ncbi:MAG: hypothetical protein AAF242_00105 [Bacteroidota bacterium]
MTRRQTDRQLSEKWEQYVKNVKASAFVEKETQGDKARRIKRLKSDFVAFSKYYFPKFCTAEFSKYHLIGVNKIIKSDSIYSVQALHREHAKSVVYGLLLPIFEMVNDRLNTMLLVSHNYANAEELLMPIMINLEVNPRLINDYGKQKGFRGWEVGNFTTRTGKSFRALGAGQSPRGTRNEEKRPDYILIDDIDTDEESRNQTRIDKKWKWIEKALFPCMSIKGRKRFILIGNIISKESIIVKASRMADHFQKVNILDKNEKPSWSERYTLEEVNYMISKMSYNAVQSEYFNNPITEGTVFKEPYYDRCPPLSKLQFAIAYCDPSYKSSKKNDYKAIVLVGQLKGKFYIYKAFVEQTTIANMIDWFYQIDDYVGDKCTLYKYIEVGGLQDTFYEQIFLPRLIEAGQDKYQLSIMRDDRKKTDKFTRIEATLEPLYRDRRLIFNEAEKKNPHMVRLEDQFKAIEPKLSAHDDGPDATEGAVWMIKDKTRLMEPIAVGIQRRSKNKY